MASTSIAMSGGQAGYHHSLPPGYRLLDYVIEGVLGQGSFGITYFAYPTPQEEPIAIKEYLPSEYAIRAPDQSVYLLSEHHGEDFRFGLECFINEARALQQIDHPHIVRVREVFEANNTAYMVMRFERGRSLEQILAQRGWLEEGELVSLVIPILDALERLHVAGIIHRDINEAHLLIREDGTPVLVDFGAARLAVWKRRLYRSLSGRQKAWSDPGPGPWTDLHALGATLYRAVGGSSPTPRVSGPLLKVITQALAFKPHDRPASAREWRQAFEALHPLEHTDSVAPERHFPTPEGVELIEAETPPPIRAERTVGRKLGVLALVGVANLGLFMLLPPQGRLSKPPSPAEFTTPSRGTPSPAPAPALAPTNPPPPVQVADPPSLPPPSLGLESQRAAQIALLLHQARQHLQAQRLTRPQEGNALAKYREILALDPSHREATLGIAAIADRYLQLAYQAMERHQFNQAEQYLHRAATVWPQVKGLQAAYQSLRNKRLQQARSNPRRARSQALSKVTLKKSRKQTPTPRPTGLRKPIANLSNQSPVALSPQRLESRFEQLRKRMGGDL